MTKLLTAVTLISASLIVLLAGIYVSMTDRYFPMGVDATVRLSLEESPASREQILHGLTQWSRDSGVELYLQAPADENSDASLFYGIGSASPESTQELRTFLPWQQRQVLPESALRDRNLASSYIPVGADESDRASLTRQIQDLGGEAWWTYFDWRQMLVQSLVESGAALALVTSGVLMVTSVLMWVLSRARRHDLQFLAGASTPSILAEDAEVLLRRVMAPIVALLAASSATVLLVSGAQFARAFLLPLVVGALLLLAIVLVTWGMANALSWPYRQALARRDLPGAGFGLPSEVLRLLALAVTALTLPFLVSGLLSSQQAADQAQEWSRLDNWVSVRTLSVSEDLESPTREAAIDLSGKGQMVFSKALKLHTGPDEPDENASALSLVIADQPFLDLMGMGRIDGPNWSEATISDLPEESAELLTDSLPLWLEDSAGLQAPGVHLLRWQGQDPLAAIDGATGEMDFYPTPLVLMVEDAGQSLTGNLILSSMSTGNVIFGNADAVRQSFARHGATDVILSVDRAADMGMLRAQLLNQTIWLRWISLALVLASLALSTGVGAEVWARRISRRIFVLRTAGYSWGWIARRRLFWESTSAALMTILGALFLLQLEISPWWILLLPLIYLPLSARLHCRALQRRFNTLISRGP